MFFEKKIFLFFFNFLLILFYLLISHSDLHNYSFFQIMCTEGHWHRLCR
jgi:hypothetical protein